MAHNSNSTIKSNLSNLQIDVLPTTHGPLTPCEPEPQSNDEPMDDIDLPPLELESPSIDLPMELSDINLKPTPSTPSTPPTPPTSRPPHESSSNDSLMPSSSNDEPTFEFVSVPGDFEPIRSSPTGIFYLLMILFSFFGNFPRVN